MSDSYSSAVLLLARAEPEIALLDRSRPLGLAASYQRVLDAWQQGRPETPHLQYAPGRSLLPLQRLLGALIERSETFGAEGPWLAARARELLLEGQMAGAVGTTRFIALACERFPQPRGTFGQELESTARAWIGEGAVTGKREPTFCTDDRKQPQSLWSTLASRLGELQLPVRIRIDPELMSTAACTENSVVIRAATWLTARAARRIAEHEIVGHLVPRLAGKLRLDILHCGCAGATDDEEGRALLIEERLELMDASRRAELGARHLACAFLRRGASFVDAVRCLIDLGAPVETAIRSVLRASRGGGMGREIVYLPAMQRLGRAFEATPGLEDWFRIGRVSLDFARSKQAATQTAQDLPYGAWSISTQTGT